MRFPGVWRSPGAARGLQGPDLGKGGAGEGQIWRLPRRRGGPGRALAPQELPSNFSWISPGLGREAFETVSGESPGAKVPVQSQSSYSTRGRLRMRPGQRGGAPLRLVLVLSQGKRRVGSAWAPRGTCAGSEGRREGLCGTWVQVACVSALIPRGPRLPATPRPMQRFSISSLPRLVSSLRHVSPCLLSTLQSQLSASFDFMHARTHTHVYRESGD